MVTGEQGQWVWLSDVPKCFRKTVGYPDACSATAMLVGRGVPHVVVQDDMGSNSGMGVLAFHEQPPIGKLNGIAFAVRVFAEEIAYVAPPRSRETCYNATLFGYTRRSFIPECCAGEEAGHSLESMLAESGYAVRRL